MASVSVQEAQAKLSELIHAMRPGEELLIIENNRPIARIIPAEQIAPNGETRQRQLGTLQGTVLSIADDFDAPLDDFREYMQ